jgi:mRNA-degrading endonuclease RelE of RelBE toxin-antitoxin system
MRIRAGSYRVCSRIDEGERLVVVITISSGNDVRDAVKRYLDRGLTW